MICLARTELLFDEVINDGDSMKEKTAWVHCDDNLRYPEFMFRNKRVCAEKNFNILFNHKIHSS